MLTVVLAIASTVLLVALTVYIALAAGGRSEVLFSTAYGVLPPWRWRFFLAFAAIGLLVCLFEGAHAMLSWLPGEWGSIDEHGEFVTIRTSLALLFAGGAGPFLIAFLDKATHEKVCLRLSLEKEEGLNEILKASLHRQTLTYLEEKYEQKADDLARSAHSGSAGRSYDHMRIGLTEERIVVLRELVSSAKRQRERLEQMGQGSRDQGLSLRRDV